MSPRHHPTPNEDETQEADAYLFEHCVRLGALDLPKRKASRLVLISCAMAGQSTRSLAVLRMVFATRDRDNERGRGPPGRQPTNRQPTDSTTRHRSQPKNQSGEIGNVN